MSEENKNEEVKYNKIEQSKVTDDIQEEVEDRPRVKQEVIVEGKVTERKKSLMERFIQGFAGPEGSKSVGQYVREDIVYPAVKNILADSVTSAVNMFLFGDNIRPGSGGYNRPHTGQSYGARPPRTDYGNKYQGAVNTTRGRQNPSTVGGKVNQMTMVQDFLIEDRREAMDVLSQLQYIADSYGTVSVADYYDMVGMETLWTHNTYGWYIEDLVNVSIRPVRGGYILTLPQVSHLKMN